MVAGDLQDRADLRRRIEAHLPPPVGRVRGSLPGMALLRGKAFAIDREPERVRDAYGRTSVGEKALLARRLVEAGTTFVLVGDAPSSMADGNWRVGVVVDDGASEEQVGSLGRVLTGELGGPPADLGPLLGEFLGVERAAITIERDNGTHRVKVGDGIEFTGQRMLTEDGGQITLNGVPLHPSGPNLGVAPVSTAKVSAFGFEYSGENLSGFANPFSWTG